MRYEEVLGEIEPDDGRTNELIVECADLRNKLEGATLAEGLSHRRLCPPIILRVGSD